MELASNTIFLATSRRMMCGPRRFMRSDSRLVASAFLMYHPVHDYLVCIVVNLPT